MINGIIQPKRLAVSRDIELVKYYPYYKRTLTWYQDPALCRQVDNIDFTYDLDRLKRMYRYLSSKGECYYIKFREKGAWRLVGDISLCEGKISVVICREYQNRHIGRAAIRAVLDRARELNYLRVEAEIYSFNGQSRQAFEAAGFKKTGRERFVKELL